MAGPFRSLEHRLDRRLARLELGRKTPFVADGRRKPTLVQQVLQGLEGLHTDAQGLGERIRARGNEHELLEVERVLRVRAAVDHVHHRHREDVGARTADPAEQRHPCVRGSSLRGGERDAQDRIRTETRLVLGSVELDQRLVESALIVRVQPADGSGDLRLDVPDRPQHALAAIDPLVPVAQLDRLEPSRRGAGRHRSPAQSARVEHDVDLDRRIAAGVENLTSMHPRNCGSAHRNSSLARSKYRSCSASPSSANDFPSSAA